MKKTVLIFLVLFSLCISTFAQQQKTTTVTLNIQNGVWFGGSIIAADQNEKTISSVALYANGSTVHEIRFSGEEIKYYQEGDSYAFIFPDCYKIYLSHETAQYYPESSTPLYYTLYDDKESIFFFNYFFNVNQSSEAENIVINFRKK